MENKAVQFRLGGCRQSYNTRGKNAFPIGGLYVLVPYTGVGKSDSLDLVSKRSFFSRSSVGNVHGSLVLSEKS